MKNSPNRSMKSKLIDTLTKEQLRKIADGLGIKKTEKMKRAKVTDLLEVFSYNQVLKALNETENSRFDECDSTEVDLY